MKVYTLTTQFAINYGALLQCYALAKYLNDKDDIECKVLQYLPDGYQRSRRPLAMPHSFRDFVAEAYMIIRPDLLVKKWMKIRKMIKFANDNIPLSDCTYSPEQIRDNPPDADAFICGSDQIWNFKIFNNDYTYYLDFVKTGKRIAYAPSIADSWSEIQCEKVKPLLEQFDSISVREVGNVGQVQALVTSKIVKSVADPVFLLDRNTWSELATNPHIEEPYILCYFLGVSADTVEVVNKIRLMLGYKLVHLQLNRIDKFKSDRVIQVADSADFVGLIKNAAFICTNSFHCSAFSIIFEKNFCFIPKSYANERAYSLQRDFHIGNVIITKNDLDTVSMETLKVDYEIGRVQRNCYISESKSYLDSALYGKKDNTSR